MLRVLSKSLTPLGLFLWHNCGGRGSLDNFCTLWSRILKGLQESTTGKLMVSGPIHLRRSDAMRRAPLDPVDMSWS